MEQIRENNHLLPNGQLSLGSVHCQQEEKDFTSSQNPNQVLLPPDGSHFSLLTTEEESGGSKFIRLK